MIGTVKERAQEHDNLYPVWEKDTLWTRFVKSVELFGSSPYIITEGKTYSYNDVKKHAEELANSLYAIGVRPGDHVAVMMRNCPEWVFLTYAIAKLGATKIPLNVGLGRAELKYELTIAEAKFLISMHAIDRTLIEELSGVERIILTTCNNLYQEERVVSWDAFERLAEIVDEEEVNVLSRANQDPEGLSDIMFTSGSTNKPKGVTMTHDMLLRAAYGVSYTRCFECGRRMYMQFPLFHVYSYVEGLLAAQFMGCSLVMPTIRRDIKSHLKMIRDYHVNDILSLASQMTQMILEGDPKPEDYPDVHAIFWGLYTPDWLWGAAKEKFGVEDLGMGMGMTEISSCGVFLGPRDPFEYLLLYNGRPKLGGCAAEADENGCLVSVKICDPETGEELLPGTEGEIYWRGSVVTKGYYHLPDVNNSSYTKDGWFKSGDTGVLSEEGYLRFTGRKTDMYKINGENVSPFFIDTVISQCPTVKLVQCVGIPHAKYGEVGVVFIHTSDESEENRRAIERYCRDNLAKFQVPKYYFYSDSSTWPRTDAGKLHKKKLRKLAEELVARGE